MKEVHEDRFIVSVKVGAKGQITIPAEEGETLMVMGDKKRGIALLKADMFYSMMDGDRK